MTLMSRVNGKAKAVTFQDLLARGEVRMHLNSRAPGVVLPVGLLNNPHVVLLFGYKLPIPIEDLRIDYSGWSCILSFNRTPFRCSAPWESVFTLTDGRIGKSWVGDMPPEVVAQLKRLEEETPVAPPTKAKANRKLPPGWRIIDGEK